MFSVAGLLGRAVALRAESSALGFVADELKEEIKEENKRRGCRG